MSAPRRVLVLGLPYFGRLLRDGLRSRGWKVRYAAHPGRDPRRWARLAPLVARADLLYLISSRVDRASPQALLGSWWPRPIIVHWVGTDVLIAKDAIETGKASRRFLRRAVHLADAPWLVDELRGLGIRAGHACLPIPRLAMEELPPLPDAFRVLLYLPSDPFDREVFDLEAILALPAAFPAVRFTLIPSPPETLPPLPANVTAPGWVADMDALYREVSVVVRLTSHDGTSFMAIEALSRGRHVIWTHPLEGAIQAAGYEGAAAALAALVDRHLAGGLELNREGRAAVLAAFDPAHLLDAIEAHVRAAIGAA